MYVELVIGGAIGASVIYVIRRVATAWLVLPAHLLVGFEYPVGTVTDTLEAVRASIITRILLTRQVRVGPYANRRDVAVNAVP